MAEKKVAPKAPAKAKSAGTSKAAATRVTKKKVAVDTTGKETVLEEKTATDKKEVAEPAPVDDKADKADKTKKDDKKAVKKDDKTPAKPPQKAAGKKDEKKK